VSRLRIAVVVEGQGEVAAAPLLLRRIASEIAGVDVEVLRPVLAKRQQLETREGLRRYVGLAAAKLKAASPTGEPALVLLLADRDPSPQPPCLLGPEVLKMAQDLYPHLDIACVLANVEYETWFAASTESLTAYLQLKPGESVLSRRKYSAAGRNGLRPDFEGPGTRRLRISRA